MIEPAPGEAELPARLRARGEVRAAFARAGARTEPTRVYETGGLRMRFPRAGPGCEAVLINTGGGMAGGDRMDLSLELGEGADVLFTTQSAEKIYRSAGGVGQIDVKAEIGAGARLEWLPRETILFEGARLARRLEMDLAAEASLLLVESATFGRIEMGETDIDASLRDRWRVRRAGRLIFAEEMRLDRASAFLDRPAVGAGARAIATLLLVAPAAERRLEEARAALEDAREAFGEGLEAGATALEGMIVARFASRSPGRLRDTLAAVMMALRGRAAPRVWS